MYYSPHHLTRSLTFCYDRLYCTIPATSASRIFMSKDAKPLISILLPVFNNGYFLTDCLESILHQTYKNIEIIAIDDFSKHDSFKILQIYKRLDKRLRIYRKVNHYDKAITLNRSLKRAKSHYMSFTAENDRIMTER